MRNKVLYYTAPLGLLVLFTGCATVVPVYETASIKKGFDGGMGFAYQWGNYSEDSTGYQYNYVRADLLFEYGLTEKIGLGARIYGGMGKGIDWNYKEEASLFERGTSHSDAYLGTLLSLKLSSFNTRKVASSVIVDIESSLIGHFTPLISIKNKKGVEVFTLGTRFFYPFGSDFAFPLLRDVFFIVTPNLQNEDNLHIFFGVGLLPLWWEKWEQEINPHNFAVGVGFK